MEWEKLGIIYKPTGEYSWAKSHAMVPTPYLINSDVIRVYCSFCDQDGIGRPGYVDISAKDPKKIISVSKEPLLDIGIPGSFDDNGVLVTSVVKNAEGNLYMYYVGFELGVKHRYRLMTGLAISKDNGNSFERFSKTPILDRSNDEMLFRGGPYCIYENNIYKMWYVAGSSWINLGGKEFPVYNLKYIESQDGINWPNKGKTVLEPKDKDEHAFGRPYVAKKKDGTYRLFVSVRKKSLKQYRMAYAESKDGINWKRLDEKLNMDVTPNSFDSEAIMYAAYFEKDNNSYILYNGNNFGKGGIALAQRVKNDL